MNPFERLDTATRRLAELTRDRPRTGRTHDDADDDTGTVATATGRPKDLRRAAELVTLRP